MKETGKYFTFSSIVFVASENTPQTFGKDWLDQHDIFDGDMEIEQALETPPVTKVQYENGFVFEAQPERNEIRVAYDVEDTLDEKRAKLAELENYATQFARETRYIPYGAIGLNHKIAVETDGLDQLVTGLATGAQTQGLVFVLPTSNFTIKVELNTASLTTSGAPVVVFSGNFHADLQEFEDKDERYEEIAEIAREIPTTPNKLIEVINDTDL